MKKFGILSVCAIMGVTAFGQANVVKDAENAMKKGDYYTEVVKVITPAFSDPTTAELAQTYFIPGKAGFNTFDEMLKLSAIGNLPQGGEKIRSEALLGGYNYLMKALPLDSVADAKGKIKTKYSKDIINLIGGHYNDFNSVAIDFWNAENWDGAYEAWDVYCKLPYDARFKKAITALPNDTTIAEIMYNRSLAAFQTGDMEKTVKSFLEAKAKGYTKKPLYDYALAAAYQAGQNDVVTALCKEALPLYGAEDTRYIRQLINGYIEAKDYQGALNMINDAIANEPNNAQYYIIRGILYEEESINGDAMAEYQKAVDLEPENGEALFNLGRSIFNQGVKYNDEAPTDPAEYHQAKTNLIVPTFKQAIDYLEKAWNVDNTNQNALKLLETAYYMIDDDNNLKYTQDRLTW